MFVLLIGALVENALFNDSSGITTEMQRDLEGQGAIFGDKPKVTV